MSDKSGSSGKRPADKISKPEIPKVVRKSEYVNLIQDSAWDEAQDPNKPKLKSINTDDRTGNPRVAEILEKLGWGESRKSLSLPVRGGLTPDSHHFGPGYRKGLVTDVARQAFDLYPNETTGQIADRLKKKWGPESSKWKFYRMSRQREKEAYDKKESAKKKGGKRKRRKTRRKRRKSKRRKTRRKTTHKRVKRRKTRRRKR